MSAGAAAAQNGSTSASAFGVPAGAPPGAPAGPPIGGVMVTAQRRSENIQKAPIATEAVSSAEFAGRKLTSEDDLPDVTPGLVFESFGPIADFFLTHHAPGDRWYVAAGRRTWRTPR